MGYIQVWLLAPEDQGNCIDTPTGVVAVNGLHHIAKILIVTIKFYGLPIGVRSLQSKSRLGMFLGFRFESAMECLILMCTLISTKANIAIWL